MVESPLRLSRFIGESFQLASRLLWFTGGVGFVGARFRCPTGWETQPLLCDTARCGLTNPLQPRKEGLTIFIQAER